MIFSHKFEESELEWKKGQAGFPQKTAHRRDMEERNLGKGKAGKARKERRWCQGKGWGWQGPDCT